MKVPSTVLAPLVGVSFVLVLCGGGGGVDLLAQESAQEPMPGLQVVPEDMGGGSTESFPLQPRPASPPGPLPGLKELRVGPPTGLSCKADPVGELFRLSWRRPAGLNRWAGISYEVQYRTSHRTGDVYHSDGTRTSIPVWHGPWSGGGSWFGSVADELEDDWRSSAQRTQARVRARSGLGPYSGWSGISCGSLRGSPAPRRTCPAPTGLQVVQPEPGSATARVSWDRPGTAPGGGYLIYARRGPAYAPDWSGYEFRSGSATGYDWDGLKLDETYAIELYSLCLEEAGRAGPVLVTLEPGVEPEPEPEPEPFSPVVQPVVLPPPCPAPTGLVAVQTPGAFEITVTWNLAQRRDSGDAFVTGYAVEFFDEYGDLAAVAGEGSTATTRKWSPLSWAGQSPTYSALMYSVCSDYVSEEIGPVLVTLEPEPAPLPVVVSPPPPVEEPEPEPAVD